MQADSITLRRYSPPVDYIDSERRNIYIDSDLEQIIKISKQLSTVVDVIAKRWRRHETLQISKSVFDYVSQTVDRADFPHHYYDFRCFDVRICIGKKRREYFVSSIGYIPSYRFNHLKTSNGYGSYSTLEDALPVFYEVCREFVLTKVGALY